MNAELSTPVERAFSEEFDRLPLFPGSNIVPVLNKVQQDLAENRHLLCVTGQPGSGRTALIRELQRTLRRDLISIVHAPTPGALLFDLLQSFGIVISERDETVARRRLCMSLASAHQTQPVLQIIDNADTLQPADLQLLLHLFDKGFAQIILVGSPVLPKQLQGHRVQVDRTYRLPPFQLSDTGPYIRHRLRCAQLPEGLFQADAVAAVYAYSGGSPRLINRLCSTALAMTSRSGAEAVIENVIHAAAKTADEGTYRYLPIAQPTAMTTAHTPAAHDIADPPSIKTETRGIPTAAPATADHPTPPAKATPRATRVWRDAAVVAVVAVTALLLQAPLTEWVQRNAPMPDLSRVWMAIKPTTPAAKTVELAQVQDTTAATETANATDFAALQPLRSIDPDVSGNVISNDRPGLWQADGTGAGNSPDTAQADEPGPAPAVDLLSPEQLAEVARLYAARADYEIGKGDLAAARISIDRGLANDSGNRHLLELRRDLDQRDARGREIPAQEVEPPLLPAPRASISPDISEHYDSVRQDAEVRFYMRRARAALDSGDPQAALADVEAGLEAAPEDRRLLELRNATLATLEGR